MRTLHILLIIGFIALYSALIFFADIDIDFDVASELMVASVFFFALFSGFFIARQNERYTRIIGIIAQRDGLFSYLY
jgi:Ca2+/Na+ antiporter